MTSTMSAVLRRFPSLSGNLATAPSLKWGTRCQDLTYRPNETGYKCRG